MKSILITGGSGLVGRHLTSMLMERGYQVGWLSRNPAENSLIKIFRWDVTKGTIDPHAFDFADAIIHLAGAGIADKRWSIKRKQEIVDSRVKSTELIINQLKQRNKRPQLVIAASAIGYYGSISSDKVFTENDPPAHDFLGTTTQVWEKATNEFRSLGIKTIQYRLGMVLAKEGGALPKMILPVKLGLGSPVGTGKQMVPWIHITDLCGMIIAGLERKIPDGVYNAVAPAQNNNRNFMKTIAQVINRPFFLPGVPGFILRMVLGEMSVIVLEGSAISSKKIQETGFQFHFTELKKALNNLLRH